MKRNSKRKSGNNTVFVTPEKMTFSYYTDRRCVGDWAVHVWQCKKLLNPGSEKCQHEPRKRKPGPFSDKNGHLFYRQKIF